MCRYFAPCYKKVNIPQLIDYSLKFLHSLPFISLSLSLTPSFSLSLCLSLCPSLLPPGLKVGGSALIPLVRVVEFNMQLLSLFSYWETIACVGMRPDRNISVSAGNAIESGKAIYHGSARPLRLYFLLF